MMEKSDSINSEVEDKLKGTIDIFKGIFGK